MEKQYGTTHRYNVVAYLVKVFMRVYQICRDKMSEDSIYKLNMLWDNIDIIAKNAILIKSDERNIQYQSSIYKARLLLLDVGGNSVVSSRDRGTPATDRNGLYVATVSMYSYHDRNINTNILRKYGQLRMIEAGDKLLAAYCRNISTIVNKGFTLFTFTYNVNKRTRKYILIYDIINNKVTWKGEVQFDPVSVPSMHTIHWVALDESFYKINTNSGVIRKNNKIEQKEYTLQKVSLTNLVIGGT